MRFDFGLGSISFLRNSWCITIPSTNNPPFYLSIIYPIIPLHIWFFVSFLNGLSWDFVDIWVYKRTVFTQVDNTTTNSISHWETPWGFMCKVTTMVHVPSQKYGTYCYGRTHPYLTNSLFLAKWLLVCFEDSDFVLVYMSIYVIVMRSCD